MKHTGLALASSISSSANFLLLFIILNKRVGKIDVGEILSFLLKISLSAFLMGVLAWELSKFADWTGSENSIEKIIILSVSVLASTAIYLLTSKLLKIEEVDFLFGIIKRKSNLT